MNILVYVESTGDILRAVSCPAEMAPFQCGEGESWLEHDIVDTANHQIDLSTMTVVPK